MNHLLEGLNSMQSDLKGGVVDLTSLLEVRDLVREWGRQERAKGLSPETRARLLKLLRESARHEPVVGPRRLDVGSSDPSTGSDQF